MTHNIKACHAIHNTEDVTHNIKPCYAIHNTTEVTHNIATRYAIHDTTDVIHNIMACQYDIIFRSNMQIIMDENEMVVWVG